MMDVQEFKLETSVSDRGVCLRVRVLDGTQRNLQYYVFVDGTMLASRHIYESRAYADAAMIRRAIGK